MMIVCYSNYGKNVKSIRYPNEEEASLRNSVFPSAWPLMAMCVMSASDGLYHLNVVDAVGVITMVVLEGDSLPHLKL